MTSTTFADPTLAPPNVPVSAPTALVERLVFALVNAQIHGPAHSRVREAATEVATLAHDLCARANSSSTLLAVAEGQVVVDRRPLLGASLFAKRFALRLAQRGAGGVELSSHASVDDVSALVTVLSRRGGPTDLASATAELVSKHAGGVRLVPPYAGADHDVVAGDGSGFGTASGSATDAAPVDPAHGAEREKKMISLHQETVDLLQGVTIATCQGRDLDVSSVQGVVEQMIHGLSRDPGTAHSLAQYPEYDFFTFGHSIRVALVALDVARRAGVEEGLIHRIGTAALLHDVGKSLISWEVLHKRGPLTPEERREMQRHPVLGAGILLENRDSDPLAVAAAYGHHCCGDGTGYPWSCGEHEQGIVTRLVKICDVYEALTAVRPYKAAMSPAKAYRTMLSMKGQFDERLFAHFVKTMGIYPPGTRVRLDDGSLARVVEQTHDLLHPVVDVLDGEDPYDDGRHRRVDLTAPGRGDPTAVTSTLAAADAAKMLG